VQAATHGCAHDARQCTQRQRHIGLQQANVKLSGLLSPAAPSQFGVLMALSGYNALQA